MNTEQQILPQDPARAVGEMIKLIEQLIEVMDRETMALTTKDAVSFTAAQDEKQQLTVRYEQASAEFGGRLQEFRAVDKTLVDRLEKLQQELKDKTLHSSAAMERLQGQG